MVHTTWKYNVYNTLAVEIRKEHSERKTSGGKREEAV
jgi:hypothetical protein